jgi:hypothetical protein
MDINYLSKRHLIDTIKVKFPLSQACSLAEEILMG